MGYYTDFRLDADVGMCEAILLTVEANEGKFKSEYAADFIRELVQETSINTKWYDAQDDLAELAAMNEELRFIVTCEGEDVDDRWRMYIHAGKMDLRRGHVVYDDEPF